MRHPRYVAILGHRDAFGARRVLEKRALECGLTLITRANGLAVFSDAPESITLTRPSGVILGSIYRSKQDMPNFVPTAPEHAAIADSCGSFLIERCWGDYIAFLPGDGSEDLKVVRPPFCDLGCIYAEFRGLHLVASEPALLHKCTLAPLQVDIEAVASHLFTDGLRRPRTCLTGIKELLWGSRLLVSSSAAETETCWSPWDFAAVRYREDPDELARELHSRALNVIAARLRGLDKVAVMLSGGLDSSILAASVAASGTPFTCLNLTMGDRIGDERDYASLVATRLGVPLQGAEQDIRHVDVTRSEASHLARPIARSFAQSTRLAKQRLAAAVGAQAILDGGGGDNIFCSLQSVAPVADRIMREGLGRGALRTAANVAAMTEAGLMKVMFKAAQRVWPRSPAYRWPCDSRFLSPEALDRSGPVDHRWLNPPPGALPGSAAHIGVIAVVENLLETSDAGIPERAPLMAQPLVEFCLSVPSWLWFHRGHNRVVARRAFRDDLPAEIVWRRTKGTPDGFVARLFEANRSVLRDLLCDGRLSAESLLDRDAISHALLQPGAIKGHDYVRLLRIADVEAWAQCF